MQGYGRIAVGQKKLFIDDFALGVMPKLNKEDQSEVETEEENKENYQAKEENLENIADVNE